MTSNIGAHYLIEGVDAKGTLSEGARKQVIDTLKSHFRPELLNRIDDIVMFKPLLLEEIKKIVVLLTKSLGDRLKDRHIKLELTDAATAYIAESAYDPIYGARPLKRFIQRELETKISRALIQGSVAENSTIKVVLDSKTKQLKIE
jgi:ATP-dependent Clp protease ATP-binding subunit ClpB